MAAARSGTFVVGADRQRGTLDKLQRREQHLSEQYSKNTPLCFNAKAYQKTHPGKAARGRKDADATLASPMLVAIADGVSQIEDFGIDASVLPNELLNALEEMAVNQLLPDQVTLASNAYLGPISMMKDAYEATDSLGSTTILCAIMDNSSRIHSKLHPMIAILSIGDCEILILRRQPNRRLEAVFHSEMQRIDGNAQSPLQVARVDDSVDPLFSEDLALEIIEKGSAVHFVSAFQGDIVVLGSDGVFDNLFLDEISAICEEMIPYRGSRYTPVSRSTLARIVEESHAKTTPIQGMKLDTPIGRGGKMDDTSCVVGEVVEWTDEHNEAWASVRKQRQWQNLVTCGGAMNSCGEADSGSDEEVVAQERSYPSNPSGSFSEYGGSFASVGGGYESAGVRPAPMQRQGGGAGGAPAARQYRPQGGGSSRGRSRDDGDDDSFCAIA